MRPRNCAREIHWPQIDTAIIAVSRSITGPAPNTADYFMGVCGYRMLRIGYVNCIRLLPALDNVQRIIADIRIDEPPRDPGRPSKKCADDILVCGACPGHIRARLEIIKMSIETFSQSISDA